MCKLLKEFNPIIAWSLGVFPKSGRPRAPGCWTRTGRPLYPDADHLLLCDGGGSNGSRLGLWKSELQRFATVKTKVCHFRLGTSTWNKIEHRLFSHIVRPLVSQDLVVKLLGLSTKTKSSLKVKARLDEQKYPAGVQVSDDRMNTLTLTQHKFNGDWNCTIVPQAQL